MNHTDPVRASRAEATFGVLDVTDPGAYDFIHDDRRIVYVCPCGCGEINVLPIHAAPDAFVPKGVAGWTWDGNEAAPTLHPSIRRMNGCRWHGYLKAGVWEPQGDSGKPPSP